MKFQKKRILSLLGVLSAIFLFSCGEKKEDIYLECYTYDIWDGKFGENSEVSIKLDLEDRRAASKNKFHNINTDKELSVSDTHYSFDSYTPMWSKISKYEMLDVPITLKLDRITLRLEMTSDLPEYPYNRVLFCTKVPYDESGFKVPTIQI